MLDIARTFQPPFPTRAGVKLGKLPVLRTYNAESY